ncbi:GntR family transcriptional regulator [Mesorhizobium sp. M0340]|uniref:GntR family transcriptional regulator n=1 Tax=Mesorhizobium sp. M0340 TaxID=2956939 RepID=UPI0033370A59
MNTTSKYTIKKVHKRSTEAQAADRLREAIISGDIPLGARLTELLVSEQVGVSRGTIRTAFHQLVQEGLLVQVPYTGWTVMTLSANDAWELYTLRASLESLASRLVASRLKSDVRSEEIAKTLASTFTRLKVACEKGNKTLIAREDMHLHRTIVSLSHHGRLIDQYSRIEHQVRIYIRSSDALVPESADIIAQHEPIIDSLLRGDEEGAVRAAAAHNEREGDILVHHLELMERAERGVVSATASASE